MKKIIIASAAIMLLTSTVFSTSLEKRHGLSLSFGIWSQTTSVRTEIGTGGVETSVGKDGMLAAIGYTHWLQENMAMTFDLKVQALDVSNNVDLISSETESSVVSSMLLGFKYYFLKSTLASSARPFIKLGTGPYIGEQSKESASMVVLIEERTEIAIGGHAGIGVDIVTGRHFMLGVNTGYNFMSDFSQPINGSKNYSGPEFGFSFSWLFGKGVEKEEE